MYTKQNKQRGFTLLEILIALFIFSILALILSGALHRVIGIHAATEKSAERLRDLQMTFLLLSRDIEQSVNRPVLDAQGREDRAFVGSPQQFILTHVGLANPTGSMVRSNMQRVNYFWSDNTLWRAVWSELDQAPSSKPHKRRLMENISSASFQYLDKEGRFKNNWPPAGKNDQPLPRAVKISLTISEWGSISQLYIISAQTSKTTSPVKPSQPKTDETPHDKKP